MYLRRNATKKCFLAVIVYAMFCEFFIYRLQPMHWAELKCSEGNTCTKILFIADPQIQGDLAAPWPLYHLYNWDSDRYLKSTFSVVIKHFKPDVLVYLGDLMDEGSISTNNQFYDYSLRLFDIFKVNYSVETVVLPGDNDIGGEGESVKSSKLSDFETIFPQPHVISFNQIDFYKVNGMTNFYPKLEVNSTAKYKIVVSHYPVTTRQYFGTKVNEHIHPHIYFCAHDHVSKYVIRNLDLSHRETYWLNGKEVLNVPYSKQTLHEIYVPTCSYRMGTRKIGFGAAVLGSVVFWTKRWIEAFRTLPSRVGFFVPPLCRNVLHKDMTYTVFWSPERFIYLFFYLILLIILIVFCLSFCVTRLFHMYRVYRQPMALWSAKVPLLGRS